MRRRVPRLRQGQSVRPADAANQGSPRSVRSALFVEWNTYPAGAGRSRWPVNDLGPVDGAPIGIGHRHLCRLLLVHDVLTRQGVVTASIVLSEYEITDAIDACEYFELHDLAATVAEIPMAGASSVAARVFDSEYKRLFAVTDRVVEAILGRMAARPDDFPGTGAVR
jgi:hypothetical protein